LSGWWEFGPYDKANALYNYANLESGGALYKDELVTELLERAEQEVSRDRVHSEGQGRLGPREKDLLGQIYLKSQKHHEAKDRPGLAAKYLILAEALFPVENAGGDDSGQAAMAMAVKWAKQRLDRAGIHEAISPFSLRRISQAVAPLKEAADFLRPHVSGIGQITTVTQADAVASYVLAEGLGTTFRVIAEELSDESYEIQSRSAREALPGLDGLLGTIEKHIGRAVVEGEAYAQLLHAHAALIVAHYQLVALQAEPGAVAAKVRLIRDYGGVSSLKRAFSLVTEALRHAPLSRDQSVIAALVMQLYLALESHDAEIVRVDLDEFQKVLSAVEAVADAGGRDGGILAPERAYLGVVLLQAAVRFTRGDLESPVGDVQGVIDRIDALTVAEITMPLSEEILDQLKYARWTAEFLLMGIALVTGSVEAAAGHARTVLSAGLPQGYGRRQLVDLWRARAQAYKAIIVWAAYRGDVARATELLKEAKEWIEAHVSDPMLLKELRAELLTLDGTVQEGAGRIALARDRDRQAVSLFEELLENEEYCHVSNSYLQAVINQADSYFTLGKEGFGKAIQVWRSALDRFHGLPDDCLSLFPTARATALQLYGSIAGAEIMLGNHGRAILATNRGLKKAQELSNYNRMGVRLNVNMARVDLTSTLARGYMGRGETMSAYKGYVDYLDAVEQAWVSSPVSATFLPFVEVNVPLIATSMVFVGHLGEISRISLVANSEQKELLSGTSRQDLGMLHKETDQTIRRGCRLAEDLAANYQAAHPGDIVGKRLAASAAVCRFAGSSWAMTDAWVDEGLKLVEELIQEDPLSGLGHEEWKTYHREIGGLVATCRSVLEAWTDREGRSEAFRNNRR